MKNFTIFLLSIAVLFTACKKKGTTTNNDNRETVLTKYSATDFTKKEVVAYNKVQYYLMLEELYAKVADSTISAYKDKELKEKLSPANFDKMHSTMQMVQAPNPEFPNDPYDLIDTLIFTHLRMWDLGGLNINKEKNLFVFDVTDTAKIYFKWSEVSSIYNTEQLALIDLFLENKKGLLSYSSIKGLGESTFVKIAKQLYNWGTEKGGLEAFETYKFGKAYTPQEAKDKGRISEVFKVPNPDNLDDPSDVIDSAKFTALNPDSIDRVRVYFAWETDNNFNAKVKSHAYAPLYKPVSSGYKLAPTPLFLLKANGVYEKLKDSEKAFMAYFSMALARNKGTIRTDYSRNTFQGTEYLQ